MTNVLVVDRQVITELQLVLDKRNEVVELLRRLQITDHRAFTGPDLKLSPEYISNMDPLSCLPG